MTLCLCRPLGTAGPSREQPRCTGSALAVALHLLAATNQPASAANSFGSDVLPVPQACRPSRVLLVTTGPATKVGAFILPVHKTTLCKWHLLSASGSYGHSHSYSCYSNSCVGVVAETCTLVWRPIRVLLVEGPSSRSDARLQTRWCTLSVSHVESPWCVMCAALYLKPGLKESRSYSFSKQDSGQSSNLLSKPSSWL